MGSHSSKAITELAGAKDRGAAPMPPDAEARTPEAPAPGTPVSDAAAPPQKSRHGLYFFLFFWLPLIALFIFAILKGHES